MKKFAVTDEKIFYVYKALTVKNNSHAGYEDFPRTAFEKKAVSMKRKTPKIKIFHKKSTSPVKKSR